MSMATPGAIKGGEPVSHSLAPSVQFHLPARPLSLQSPLSLCLCLSLPCRRETSRSPREENQTRLTGIEGKACTVGLFHDF